MSAGQGIGTAVITQDNPDQVRDDRECPVRALQGRGSMSAPTPSETGIGSGSQNCSGRSARADGSGGNQTRWNRVTRLPFL